MKKIYYFNIINFLAAFLLFQIELIISKILLPKFGGSYLVWGACIVFFQCMLLLGYLYSHLVIQKLGMFLYRNFHLVLLFIPLLFFPGRSLPNIYARQEIPMVIDVFRQLLLSIGLVFFVLSTTSIVFQSWLAASELPEKSNPYVLYAISNLGSFLALLTYPFFFEARFDLNAQLNIWRIGYLTLLAFSLIVFKLIKIKDHPAGLERVRYEINAGKKWRWFLLSAASVIAFISVTNIITYEIAPTPLLWILPLCIYLISFVLNFKERPFCPDWIRNKFHLTVAFSVILFFLTQQRIFPFSIAIIAYSISLFIICMFCQNEIVKNKPKETEGLTLFYLIIATGSFLGGILVSWVVPLIFPLMIEYLLGLYIIYSALIIEEERTPISFYNFRLVFYAIALLILWPLVFKRYNIFGLMLIFFSIKFIYTELKTKPQAIYLSLLSFLLLAPFLESLWTDEYYIYTHRNYYGIYKIYDKSGIRFILNGTTLHGAQYIAGTKELEPLTYYHRATPVGKLMDSNIFNFQNIGVLGLGAGSLAAYGKKNQVMDFFELDLDVFRIADKYFTYLKKSPTKINYLFGDARISLSKSPLNRYDLLIIDAFSGDSVPIHLLTTEAISEYKKHIRQDGLILFHISNRYLRLDPVLLSNAGVLNAYFCSSENDPSPPEVNASQWVALTWNKAAFGHLTEKLKWSKVDAKKAIKKMQPWTDSYSNVLSILKLRSFLNSIKEFRPFYW